MKRVKPALRLSKAGRNFKYDEHGKLAMLIFKETLCQKQAQKNEFGSCASFCGFLFLGKAQKEAQQLPNKIPKKVEEKYE